MPNILEASVKLFAEDSQLRASFQGLAPQAHLAGITVGERFAAGMAKAASQAHAAFQKEFIGPLQSEAFGTGIGRGMEPTPSQQFRASDLAAHKGVVTAVQSHGQALALSGDKAEQWNLSVREATQSARLFAGTLMSSVNPQLGNMELVAGEAIRALKGLGFTLAGAGAAAAIGAVALITYIERVKDTIAAKSRLDQAIAAKDPAAASAEIATRTKALEELITSTKVAAESSKLPGGLGLFGTGKDAPALIAMVGNIGKSIEEKRAQLAEAQKESDKLTRTVTFPQIDAHAAVEENQLLLQKLGLERLSIETVDDLAASTQRLRAAKEALVEAAIKELDVTERVKLQNIFKAAEDRKAPVAQDVQDKLLGDITRKQQNLREAARAVDAEDRRQANRDRVTIEERQRAHAIELGRINMADQLELERAATIDMGRTLQEREDAERKVFQTRRAMAESLLMFQNQMSGKSNFKESIDIMRGFMSELIVGSAAWFAQTAKVADLFTRMREEAHGIFSQQASIAESQASREGRGSITIDEVPDLLRRVRERDEAALRGDRVQIGDLGAAVGRLDLFRKMDKENLSPREAFSRMMEDPSKNLARALGGAGDVPPVLTGLADAATLATRALLGLAGASSRDVGGQAAPGLIRRPPGGPPLSEDNRQAIMDAIAGQLTDENLAVYGRR